LNTQLGPLSQREFARASFYRDKANCETQTILLNYASTEWPGIFQLLSASRRTCELLRRRTRWDICLVDSHFGALPALALRITGRTRVLAYDDIDFRASFARSRIGRIATRWLERFIVSQADIISSVSRVLLEVRRSQTRKPIILLPNGIDYSSYEASRTLRTPSSQIRTLIYFGYVARNRGVFDPLSLLRDDDSLRYVVFGTGPDIKELTQIIARENLSKVQVLGLVPQSRIPEALCQGDIALALYHRDSHAPWASPLKIIEALAAGLPVITRSYVPMADELVEHRCGLIADNINELASAISRLRDPGVYFKASKAAVSYAKNFDWNRIFGVEFERWKSLLHGNGVESATKKPTGISTSRV